ncbi:type II toxin-antitoxin system RelE/ParE family toxin, partial [Thioalkalivibrio sp. ALE16]|uniref:type II toxin-antitoxin system RelE/ParE family toxin n=1 Tax=Thioalkalivibrio sp. ALE16 TaxID=1158172 RepID=UPI001E4A5113
SAAFACARRCGSLVQNDCTAVTAPCSHTKATRARTRDSISVSLEALKGDRAGQYSIRINDQWRICFEWRDGHAYNVEIVDYH